ncbi:hypothetical protein [Rhodobacter calidifons]|nr:hypothetical protein [Rhodobacter calidifons]
MMPRVLCIACLILAACGADGPPEPPSRGAALSGEVKVGAVFR